MDPRNFPNANPGNGRGPPPPPPNNRLVPTYFPGQPFGSNAVPAGSFGSFTLSSFRNKAHEYEDADFLRHLMNKLQKEPIPRSMRIATCNGYPCVYLCTVGCISVLLTPDVKIDIAVDRSMRITCFGKFVATLCSNNKSASLSHEHATIYQHEGYVYSVFRSDGVPDKQVVIGDDAVLFTMENLNDTFILSKSGHVSPVARRLCAPLKRDITVRQFYSSCEIGARYLDLCHELVSRAHFSTVDGELQVIVNGIHIVHDRNGNVEILSKPRLVRITPMTGAVQMRSTTLEMAVDGEGRGYIISGVKRAHASGTGLVLADGPQVASMDNQGKLITSS
uniref:FHA domain-containing protein n=1 Tax=Panagrolaimus sp. JU765 TaxID=591449 RepID=A0AC34QP57_9BILA